MAWSTLILLVSVPSILTLRYSCSKVLVPHIQIYLETHRKKLLCILAIEVYQTNVRVFATTVRIYSVFICIYCLYVDMYVCLMILFSELQSQQPSNSEPKNNFLKNCRHLIRMPPDLRFCGNNCLFLKRPIRFPKKWTVQHPNSIAAYHKICHSR